MSITQVRKDVLTYAEGGLSEAIAGTLGSLFETDQIAVAAEVAAAVVIAAAVVVEVAAVVEAAVAAVVAAAAVEYWHLIQRMEKAQVRQILSSLAAAAAAAAVLASQIRIRFAKKEHCWPQLRRFRGH